MSRTKKDIKKNKKWNRRHTEYKAGFRKALKRASNKKIRHTPITSPHLDMQYSEQTVTLKIPQNIIPGSTPTVKDIEVTITIKTPTYTDIENHPVGLDSWLLD